MISKEIEHHLNELRELRILHYGSPIRVYGCKNIKIKNKLRSIQKPFDGMVKTALIEINKCFTRALVPDPCITSNKGMGIIENARRHISAQHILKLDIQDFYRNCRQEDTAAGLIKHSAEGALLAQVTNNPALWYSEGSRPFLPTGSPTSPWLSQWALSSADQKIKELIPASAVYTRYLDDLTISFTDEVPEGKDRFLREIVNIVEGSGWLANWKINWSKTKWLNPLEDEWSVTGINIRDNKLSVSRGYLQRLRPMINSIARDQCGHGELPPCLIFLNKHQRGHFEFVKQVNRDQYIDLLNYLVKRIKIMNKTEQWPSIYPPDEKRTLDGFLEFIESEKR